MRFTSLSDAWTVFWILPEATQSECPAAYAVVGLPPDVA